MVECWGSCRLSDNRERRSGCCYFRGNRHEEGSIGASYSRCRTRQPPHRYPRCLLLSFTSLLPALNLLQPGPDGHRLCTSPNSAPAVDESWICRGDRPKWRHTDYGSRDGGTSIPPGVLLHPRAITCARSGYRQLSNNMQDGNIEEIPLPSVLGSQTRHLLMNPNKLRTRVEIWHHFEAELV